MDRGPQTGSGRGGGRGARRTGGAGRGRSQGPGNEGCASRNITALQLISLNGLMNVLRKRHRARVVVAGFVWCRCSELAHRHEALWRVTGSSWKLCICTLDILLRLLESAASLACLRRLVPSSYS